MGSPALPRSFFELRTLRLMSFAYHSLNTGYWGKGKQTGKNPVFMRVCGEMALKS